MAKSIVTGRRFLKGYAKWEELHDVEWCLEGEAFALEYYGRGETSYWPKLSKYDRIDLIKVRLSGSFTHRESVVYLKDLAYFLVSVIGYVGYSPNGIPPGKYAKFMCPVIFTKHFKNVAYKRCSTIKLVMMSDYTSDNSE